MDKTFYDILEIEQNATKENIKKAYFKLVKQFHPDVNKNADQAHFSKIKEAYENLFDEKKRQKYDKWLKTQKTSGKKKKEVVEYEEETNDEKEPPSEKTPPKEQTEEYKDYRNHLIKEARSKIIVSAFVGAFIGFFYIFSLDFLASGRLSKTLFDSLNLPLGIIATSNIFFFFSLDNNFSAESFMQTTKSKTIFSYLRSISLSLSFLFLVILLIKALEYSFSGFSKYSLVIFGIGLVLASLIGADRHTLTRIKQRRFLEIFILIVRSILFGIGGAILAYILITIIQNYPPQKITDSVALGFCFAVIIGSVAPHDIQSIASKISHNLKYPLIIALLLIGFSVGILIGKIF